MRGDNIGVGGWGNRKCPRRGAWRRGERKISDYVGDSTNR